jgi:hypothetical protein
MLNHQWWVNLLPSAIQNNKILILIELKPPFHSLIQSLTRKV